MHETPNNYKIALMPLLVFSTAAIAYFIGAGTFRPSIAVAHEKKVAKLDEIIQTISENYVDSLEQNELIDKTIESLLSELDPHSAYIPAHLVKQRSEQLQGYFGGVGIRFIILRDTLMVTNLVKGGPAELTGLLPGDRILKVDSTSIAGIGLSTEKVFELLKGEIGTPVHLTIHNKKGKNTFKVIRGQIPLYSIDAKFMLTDNIGYIKLSSFSETTGHEFRQAIHDLQRRGMTQLIFDLRGNGGGYLNQAIEVADQFLEKGKMIVYTQGTHQKKREFFATSYGSFQQNDLVILVNQTSASASEIVSGAIQDNDRGTILGRRTFGKGLVQQRMNLSDSSEMRLTVSRYYTPTGRCIQKPYGKGIDYENEFYERYENGEFNHLDSSVFDTTEKYITPQGKILYGGGGIHPDIFVPVDTTGSSIFAGNLAYSTVYRDFAFDYVDKNRDKLKYKSEEIFDKKFIITDILFKQFLNYAASQGIVPHEGELKKSEKRINNQLKAEIAFYLWDQDIRWYITRLFDKDVDEAIKTLQKKK